MMLVSTPTKHCIQSRSPTCDSAMAPYYTRRHTPPRFASEPNPFDTSLHTPSPFRQRPLFSPPMKEAGGLFSQSPHKAIFSNPFGSKPQPISADDEEGSIFLSPDSSFAATPAPQPLQTPVKQNQHPLNHITQTLNHPNPGLSPPTAFPSAQFDSVARTGGGTKRKSNHQNTPLRQHNLTPLTLTTSSSSTTDERDKSSFLFDRLAPLPTPKTNAFTPQTKAETDLFLRRQTATLIRLRISDRDDSGDDFNSDADDSGCEMDDDEANTLFLSNTRMKNKVPSLGKSAGRTFANKGKMREEVAEAISPGGRVTKRRARSRPVSAELKQSARLPGSPGRILASSTNAVRTKARSTVAFPSSHTRSPSGSSISDIGSPVPRRRISAVVTRMPPPPKLPELQPRPSLNRLESVSSATLFFGPPIPQSVAEQSVRSRTNTLLTLASPDPVVRASVKRKANRHSYADPDDFRAWNIIQQRLPSPGSSPSNADGGTDLDDDMDFEAGPPNTSFVLNVTSDTPSPPKTTLQSKYKPRNSGAITSDDAGGMNFAGGRSLERGNSLFPVARSSTSVSSGVSDDGLVTPGIAPDSSVSWPDANVFIRGTDDNGRTLHGTLESGVDVDAFIMRTLASAANGPHEVTKRVPGTPVKRIRTTNFGGDRPWQSAVAAKVGPRLDFDEKRAKVPRKSLPAVFPGFPRRGDKSADSSDSEGDQDSPSSRKDPKYGPLGLGRPVTADASLALNRTRWLMRRSSSGAFSSGSDSTSITTTPTRGKVTDWQLPKPRIPPMFSQSQRSSLNLTPARSASGSSNSSAVTVSPTDRSRYLNFLSGTRHPEPRSHSLATAEFTTEQSGRFEREFVELAEVGSGEFGKVIKARHKGSDDSEIFAIKKSKRFEGTKHRLRLREEVDILRHLSQAAFGCHQNGRHSNVLAYIDSWEEDQALFIQTELCESGNLAHFLWEYGRVFPRLDEARVWKIIADMSNGLRFIHNAGVIHLDLKPSNVFLTKDGRFKIGDFGMASMWPRPCPSDSPRLGVDSEERGAFEREGDKLYLAPEVLQGHYGKEADIFSLGMTILETASNIVVPDQGEAWHRLRREDFSQIDLREESEELIGLIGQMMRREPGSRISAQGIYEHVVVAQARASMERMIAEARREGRSEFVGSPLASVPGGFLEEILGHPPTVGWDMDISP